MQLGNDICASAQMIVAVGQFLFDDNKFDEIDGYRVTYPKRNCQNRVLPQEVDRHAAVATMITIKTKTCVRVSNAAGRYPEG